jgi:PhnB protein
LQGKLPFVTMMTYGESPLAGQTSPDMREKILHATLAVGDQVVGGADAPPEHYRTPQGISVVMNMDDTAEAERVFAALAEEGAVQMPLQKTFWALRVRDASGPVWYSVDD